MPNRQPPPDMVLPVVLELQPAHAQQLVLAAVFSAEYLPRPDQQPSRPAQLLRGRGIQGSRRQSIGSGTAGVKLRAAGNIHGETPTAQ